jgi:uncharacterized protein YjbJ (UPF0337 family)
MKEFNMSGNTDKAAGIANEAAGKVKQGVGKAIGSEKLQECRTGSQRRRAAGEGRREKRC